ncbi:MAG: DUF4097 domain-containing protein [Bacteroidetes bacterium]|nr:DUF4097 domain-containing protein [Bacteroidota bacterium]
MKTEKIILMIFLLSAFTFLGAQDKIKKTHSFQVSKDGELELYANPGEITVDTWDKNEVVVKLRGDEEDYDLRNVKIEQRNNKVIVKYDSHWGWSEGIDLVITLPKNFNASINTTGGDVQFRNDINGKITISTSAGDISMANVSGDLSLNTQGGDIRLRDVNGNIDVNTQGGEIRIGKINGKSARINTMGGDIDISSIGSDAKVKTYGGEIRIGDVDGNAEVITFGGDIELGNVGGSVNMETYGGNLSLKSAKGDVEASTYAGDINLRNIKGSIKAKTNAGNITAELFPTGKNRSVLKTSNGEVTLYLPENAKADIEAAIRVRGWWKQMKDDFQIKSDFPGSTNKFNEDEKEISAHYSINGGGEKITISTFNSSIKIKKIRSGN